jgi:hypothetical protein
VISIGVSPVGASQKPEGPTVDCQKPEGLTNDCQNPEDGKAAEQALLLSSCFWLLASGFWLLASNV